MYIQDTLHTAYRGVRGNVMRSLLTMLGIIIGVGSVVLMTGIGKSMEGVILGQISSLGAKSMVLFPGSGPEGGGGGAIKAGFDSLTFGDVDALERLTSIASISPVVLVPGDVQQGRERSSASVFGTVPNFFLNQSIDAMEGRLIISSDVEGAKSVAILGPDVAEDLFPGSSPIGRRVTIAQRTFTVVGMTKSIGTQFFQNADDRIYIPLSTARAITGQKYVSYMTFQTAGNFDLAFADVKYLLRRRHGISNPDDEADKDDFVVRSSQQASDILGSVSLSLTLFITFIAAISLVVGGIGIMNIMLVAVRERTREIGLRKALGARKQDILYQFLIEAILLTLTGGIIGAAAGVFLAFVIATIAGVFLASYQFAISPLSILLAFVIAGATGLIFGIYPARQASLLRPIESLRYE